jgi:hypothetical protein
MVKARPKINSPRQVSMRSQLLIAAAAAALAFPVAASAADPALDAFESICWKTSADFPAVVQAADSGGWTNAELMADAMAGVSVTDKTAREKIGGGSDLKLLATRGTKGDIVVRTCTISAKGGQAGLLDRAKTWLGVAPQSSDAGKATYLVTLDGGKIVALAQGEVDAAVAKGGVHLIKFHQDGTNETLDYTRISK